MNHILSKQIIFRSICLALILSIFYSFALPVGADTVDANCKSAVLMDANTGKVILEKNAHEKLPPASVTKVMTMLLIMEAVDSGKISFDDKVTISKQSCSSSTEGTMLLLEAGEVRTVKELLYGIAIESANDACLAMAEYISGSIEEFVKLMNKRAQELGMMDTNFANPNGLPDSKHVTSAYDIAIMSKELVKHQSIFEFISKYMITLYVGKNNDVKRELVNKNKLLYFYKDIDGIKTGFTQDALYCISLTSKRNNLRLISVIMGAPSTDSRNKDARKLLDYGFANYTNYAVAKAGEIVQPIRVSKGTESTVNAVIKENINVLLQKGEDKNIKSVVNLPKVINAPIIKGQAIGELIVYKDNVEIGKYPLIADTAIAKSSFFNHIKRSFMYWSGTK